MNLKTNIGKDIYDDLYDNFWVNVDIDLYYNNPNCFDMVWDKTQIDLLENLNEELELSLK